MLYSCFEVLVGAIYEVEGFHPGTHMIILENAFNLCWKRFLKINWRITDFSWKYKGADKTQRNPKRRGEDKRTRGKKWRRRYKRRMREKREKWKKRKKKERKEEEDSGKEERGEGRRSKRRNKKTKRERKGWKRKLLNINGEAGKKKH